LFDQFYRFRSSGKTIKKRQQLLIGELFYDFVKARLNAYLLIEKNNPLPLF
jgi:hypothetical protein